MKMVNKRKLGWAHLEKTDFKVKNSHKRLRRTLYNDERIDSSETDSSFLFIAKYYPIVWMHHTINPTHLLRDILVASKFGQL